MKSIESEPPDAVYQRNVAHHVQAFRESKQRLSAISSTRRYLLYAMAACLVSAFLLPDVATVAFIIAIVLIAVAALQYRTDFVLTRKCVTARNKITINQSGIARRARDWDEVAEIPVDESIANLPVSIDLDIVGHASVMKLLCTAETEGGVAMLTRWIVDSVEPEEVRRRQHICNTLAPNLDWRQELQRYCMTIGDNAERTRDFQSWAKDSTPLELPFLLRAYVSALRFIVPIVLAMFVMHPPTATAMFAAVVTLNIVLTIVFSGDVHSFFRTIRATPDAHSHSDLSDTFSHLSDSAELRETMPHEVRTCDQAVVQLRRLERILRLESISRNWLLVWFFYFPLQFLLLWDLQLFLFSEGWQKTSGHIIERAFDVLADVEALCSLASLRYEHPSWEFPELIETPVPAFVAKQLGHPLIPDGCRVANDIEIGPPGTCLLITGSNMGGKSTLLRAIGVNAMLAQAGAPCCCQSLSMSRLKVMACMRVSDSLSDSTSMFMAQLLNLKRVVDQLRSSGDGANDVPVMYLFDEILNGTNTSDRRMAVESLMGYLLQCRTVGAMTTHDLEIAKESKHRASFDTRFLGHQLVGDEKHPEIKYDYRLQPGIAPTSNAMLLLQLLGLPEA